MIQTAKRLDVFAPQFFAVLSGRLAALRAEGHDVIRLDEGSPDLPPPDFIIQALTEAASNPDVHGYQPHQGPPGLRSAWAEMYLKTYGVDLDPRSEIMPLLGSKEGIFHTLLAYIEPGDVVLIPDPGYMTYSRGTLFAGGEPYYLDLRPENGYLPDLKAVPVDVARRAKILWMNYPNNPTTAIATREFFAQAIEFAREFDVLLCHDAAYSQVMFDGTTAKSILEIPGAKDVAVEFNTLSKSHNMAGWRVGALLGNASVAKALFTLKTNADSSHYRPVLEAAMVAMTGDQSWITQRNEIYRRRRDLVVQSLQRMGFTVTVPQGSLYVWSPTPAKLSALDFVNLLLEKANVSITPGTVFGDNGEGYVRISITAPSERIAEAMERIESVVSGLG